MTEAEWLTGTDPFTLLRGIDTRIPLRKRQLYLCAGCRKIESLLYHPISRAALDITERILEGKGSLEEYVDADPEIPAFGYELNGTELAHHQGPVFPLGIRKLIEMGLLSEHGIAEGRTTVETNTATRLHAAAELVYLAHLPYFVELDRIERYAVRVPWPGAWLVRDIFGNPFRPSTIDPTWLTWNNGTVAKIAHTIYDDRRFDIMPILGDALEDAGCVDGQILGHCRGPGPHVRGCWAVDIILGKDQTEDEQ